MRRSHLFILFVLAAAVTLLTACSTSASTDPSSTSETTDTEMTAEAVSPSTTTAAETSATETTAGTDTPPTTSASAATETTQSDDEEPNCGWDSPRLASDDVDDIPYSGMGGAELAQAMIGSWQHTHIDTGGGFEPVKPTTDIRFVLTADKFLYCQDVQGATKQAENSAPLKVEGVGIILPSPAKGYAVVGWNDDTMVWLNHYDESFYLLQRR